MRDPNFDPAAAQQTVNKWIAGETEKTAIEITKALEAYRYNEASEAIYKFTWNIFCDWYVELIKPLLNGTDEAAKAAARNPDGLIGLYLAAGVLGCLYVGVHFIYHSPWYLGKFLVEGGKVQHPASPEAKPFRWLVVPFLHSYPIGFLIGLHYSSVGFILESIHR